jgi:hypothetical protein
MARPVFCGSARTGGPAEPARRHRLRRKHQARPPARAAISAGPSTSNISAAGSRYQHAPVPTTSPAPGPTAPSKPRPQRGRRNRGGSIGVRRMSRRERRSEDPWRKMKATSGARTDARKGADPPAPGTLALSGHADGWRACAWSIVTTSVRAVLLLRQAQAPGLATRAISRLGRVAPPPGAIRRSRTPA